jgi:hypothetical protein
MLNAGKDLAAVLQALEVSHQLLQPLGFLALHPAVLRSDPVVNVTVNL